MCWIEWKIIFFRFFVFQLLAAKELPIRLQKINLFKSCQIYREDWDGSDNDFSRLVFEIYSILLMTLLTIFKCFESKLGQKWCLSQQMYNVLIGVFVFVIFFCTIFSFWVMVDFINDFVHNFHVFWVQNRSKMMFISKSAQCSNGSFCIPEFFYCAILSFWVMVDFIFYLCSIQSGLRKNVKNISN